MAPECRLPCRSPGLALGLPRPSHARKSIWFGLLPSPVIPPLRKPTLSLMCQAVELSTRGIVAYQSQKRGLLNLVKNRDSWAPPRTHESESPGVGPGNLDLRAPSRGLTGSFNPFIFLLKKPGLREGSALREPRESGYGKPSLESHLGCGCCPFPALAPTPLSPPPSLKSLETLYNGSGCEWVCRDLLETQALLADFLCLTMLSSE